MKAVGHGMRHDMTATMRTCLAACDACRNACLVGVAHCIEKGGAHAEARHLETMLDCIAICTTTADYLARGSERHADVCRVCARVCRACEASCRALEGETMRRCAEACAACAEACERTAA